MAVSAPSEANRLRLDYRAEAERFEKRGYPIYDCHTHINGDRAARIYREARDLYGSSFTYSQTSLEHLPAVRGALGDTVRFVAIPDYSSKDRAHAVGPGFIDAITRWHGEGARMVKFWCAPRGRDFGRDAGDPALMTLDSPWRRRQMDHAASLGMMFMAHIADPDTWFRTKYTDTAFYGTKASQYEPLERLAEEYRSVPWLLAHMGGWPEDLDFLDGLLTRHDNLNLDTSATKWMVRELSAHPTPEVVRFFTKWSHRIVFGTDIVTSESHVGSAAASGPPMHASVKTAAGAFDLYASRYWALRSMFETDYDGDSPIADPDLALTDPGAHDALSAPRLRGHRLPAPVLRAIYHDTPRALFDPVYAR